MKQRELAEKRRVKPPSYQKMKQKIKILIKKQQNDDTMNVTQSDFGQTGRRAAHQPQNRYSN